MIKQESPVLNGDCLKSGLTLVLSRPGETFCKRLEHFWDLVINRQKSGASEVSTRWA